MAEIAVVFGRIKLKKLTKSKNLQILAVGQEN